MPIEIKCRSCKTTSQVPGVALSEIRFCPKCGQEIEHPGGKQADEGPAKAEAPSTATPHEVLLTVVRPRRSRLAIASLVLGVLGIWLIWYFLLVDILGVLEPCLEDIFAFCLLPSIFCLVAAIILGHRATSSISRSKGSLTGKGMATAGRWLGGVSVALTLVTVMEAPRGFASRASMNDTAAFGNLKTIAIQQALFKDARKVDQNGNHIGEYGLLAELCGEIALRPEGTTPVSPPFISQEFRTQGSGGMGYAKKAGYMFKIYLSNATATDPTLTSSEKELGGSATRGGPKASDTAIKLQEQHFVIYAWPADLRTTGEWAFVITESGQVYATRMRDASGTPVLEYNGSISIPAADAAFIGPVFSDKISSKGTPGNDGNQWNPVGG